MNVILPAALSVCPVFQGNPLLVLSVQKAMFGIQAIKDFTNQAAMVYAPLASTFNEGLKDVYTKQTRLDLVEANGDLELEGEIVCVGIVANMNFILICTYELDGANPELIIYKKR